MALAIAMERAAGSADGGNGNGAAAACIVPGLATGFFVFIGVLVRATIGGR
jgi:hypothetical protein